MDFASQNLTAGQLNAIVKKLGGEEGAMRFLRGELAVGVSMPHDSSIWKTIKLGTCKSPTEYRTALKKAGRRIGDCGDDILGRIACSQEELDLDLVVLSVGDLGFKGKARYEELCSKAVSLGLELCPAEVGPALCLQYGDQPRDEWLRIAMEAIADSDGGPCVLCVGHGRDGLWLIDDFGHPGIFWNSVNRFVFVKPRVK